MRRLLGALQFLTMLPIGRATSSPGEAALFFPLVGALLGACAGIVARYCGAVYALAFLCIATGCLHEDGLADVADAFRAGRSRELILQILKDSRIGTYGAMALIASFAIRWDALGQAQGNLIYGLAAALALSRGAMVALAAFTPAVSAGMGTAFRQELSGLAVGVVMLQATGLAFLAGWRQALPLIAATAAVTVLARMYFVRRLGAVNGDCLGATCHVVETVNLVILAWRPSF